MNFLLIYNDKIIQNRKLCQTIPSSSISQTYFLARKIVGSKFDKGRKSHGILCSDIGLGPKKLIMNIKYDRFSLFLSVKAIFCNR